MNRLLSPHSIVAILIVVMIGVQPTYSADAPQLIRDAVALHDQGEFDEAIDLLEQALDEEPNNAIAVYELVFTHQAKGDYKSCTKTAAKYLRRIRKDPDQQQHIPDISMLQASCHSAAGESRKALKVFRTGLKDSPDNYGLNFNIAITLINESEFDEAIKHLEKAALADLTHPSPYYVLGYAYQSVGRGVEGLLAYLKFLQREFNTNRSTTAAQAVIEIAFSSVNSNSTGGGATISLDPRSLSGHPDISALALTLAVSAAANSTNGKIDEPYVDSITSILESFISIGADLDIEVDSDSFFATHLAPDVFGLEGAGVTLPFTYFLASTAGVEGANDWLDDNSAEIDALIEHFQMRDNLSPNGQ